MLQLIEQCGGTDVVFDHNGKRIGGALLLAVVRRRPVNLSAVIERPLRMTINL